MNMRTNWQSLLILGFFLLLGSPIIVGAAEAPASEEPAQSDYFAEEDFLDMEGMAVTGNQELPKSLMVVPWQEPVPGDLFAGEFKSLIDVDPEVIDRDEFRRELDYYQVREGKILDATRN